MISLVLVAGLAGEAGADQEAFWTWTTRAAGFVAEGKQVRAVEAAARARTARAAPELDAMVGLAALAGGQPEAALKQLSSVVKKGSTEPLVFYWTGRAALASGEAAAALKQVNRAIAVGGDRPAFRMTQAILLNEAGKRAEALEALARVARAGPNLLDPGLYPSPTEGAVDLMGAMLKRFPHRDQLSRTRAHLLWRAGRSLAAYRMFRDLARAMPADSGIKQMLAQAQARVGLKKQAMITAEEASALAPEAPDALATLGELRLAAGDAARAVMHLKKAVDGRPADAPLLLKLAQACSLAEDHECAEKFYGYALRRDNQLAGAHFGLASSPRVQKEPERAWRSFARALSLEPGNARYYRTAAHFMALQKQKKRAAALLREARRATRLERTIKRARDRDDLVARTLMQLAAALENDPACSGACARLAARLPGVAAPFARAHLALAKTPERPVKGLLAPVLRRLKSKNLLRTDPTQVSFKGKTGNGINYVIKNGYVFVPPAAFR